MSGIFVSYRRASSSAVVYRLVDELKERFGDEAIFFDVESIDPGMSFAQAIQQALAKSTIALIVIGPTWAHVTDESGNRRLENPDDWVRHEVHAALNSRARVIPLLVEGAEIPSQSQLPSNIQELSSLQAFTINKSPEYWDFDVKRLEERLRKIDRNLPRPNGGEVPQPSKGHFSKKVIWGCGLATLFGFFLLTLENNPPPVEEQSVADIAEQMYGLVFFFGLAFALNWMGLSDINKGLTKGKGFAIGGMVFSALMFVISLGLGAVLELADDMGQGYANTDGSRSGSGQQQQEEEFVPEPREPPPVVPTEQPVADVQRPQVKPPVQQQEDDSDFQPASAPNIAGTWSSNIGASYQFGNNLNGTVFFYEFNALQVQVGYGEGAYEDGLFRFQYTNTLFQTGAPLELQLSGNNTLRGTLYNPITGQPASSIEMYKVSAGY